jgi:hypothetical protein
VAIDEYRALLTFERKIKDDSLSLDGLERLMIEEFRKLMRNQVHLSVEEC